MATTSSKSRIGRFFERFFGLRDNASGNEADRNFEKVRTSEQAFESVDRGTLFVPINKIVGSVGRYHDFDAHFRPKGYYSDERLHA